MYAKKLILMWVCMTLIFSFSMTAYADTNENTHFGETYISPKMTYIAKASSNVTITSSGQAQVECYVAGHSSIVTRVKIKADLQQYKNDKWTSVKTWSTSKNKYRVTLAKSIQVSKGYSYRVVATVTAYKNSDSETKTVTSSEAKY